MNYAFGAIVIAFAICCALIPFTQSRPTTLYVAVGCSVAFVLFLYGRLFLLGS